MPLESPTKAAFLFPPRVEGGGGSSSSDDAAEPRFRSSPERNSSEPGYHQQQQHTSRLISDLGPSLSSVLGSFDFSSPHSSLGSSSGNVSARSSDLSSSGDSTNLTTNPGTPALNQANGSKFASNSELKDREKPLPVPTLEPAAFWNTARQRQQIQSHAVDPAFTEILDPSQTSSSASQKGFSPPYIPVAPGTSEGIVTFPDTPPVAVASSSSSSSSSSSTTPNRSHSLRRKASGSGGSSSKSDSPSRSPSKLKRLLLGPSSTKGSERVTGNASDGDGGAQESSPSSGSLATSKEAERIASRPENIDHPLSGSDNQQMLRPLQSGGSTVVLDGSRKSSNLDAGRQGEGRGADKIFSKVDSRRPKGLTALRQEGRDSVGSDASSIAGLATIATASATTIRRLGRGYESQRMESQGSATMASASRQFAPASSLQTSSSSLATRHDRAPLNAANEEGSAASLPSSDSGASISTDSAAGSSIVSRSLSARTNDGESEATSVASISLDRGLSDTSSSSKRGFAASRYENKKAPKGLTLTSLETGGLVSRSGSARSAAGVSAARNTSTRSARSEGGNGRRPSPVEGSRANLGSALDVVPEVGEGSMAESSSASMASFDGRMASHLQPRPRAESIVSTITSFSEEPTWGQSLSVATSAPDPALDTLAAFAFPNTNGLGTGPAPSKGLASTLPTPGGFVNARHIANPASVHHSGMQTLAVTTRHAPGSSASGSVFSTGGASVVSIGTKEELLSRLVADQARVDIQDYGTMSLEQVAETKKELMILDKRISDVKRKLGVEIKIRDAAVALRKAHRRTPSTASNASGAPPSPAYPKGLGFDLSTASPLLDGRKLPIRSRTMSFSSDAKIESDVTSATAKVDSVSRELFVLSEKAHVLRRKILEHQAAVLAQRIDLLEGGKLDDQDPFFLPASISGEFPSASQSSDSLADQASGKALPARGLTYLERHARLESEASAQSGFSFLGASEKAKNLEIQLSMLRTNLDEVEEELEREKGSHATDLEESEKKFDRLVAELNSEKSARIHELESSKLKFMEAEQRCKAAEAQLREATLAEQQRLLPEVEAAKRRAEKAEADLIHERHMYEARSRTSAEDVVRKTETVSKERDLELENLRRALESAEARIATQNETLASQSKDLLEARRRLEGESMAKTQMEGKVATSELKANASAKAASEADSKLQELELAVRAERRLMAEREELFHAFERRLESAEKRLQVTDKRCAQLLGKLDGREEMDNLLELIKTGAGGSTRKKKTAGQDIADLLTSIETHVEDLAGELARGGNAASPAADSPTSTPIHELEKELRNAEAQVESYKKEADVLKNELAAARAAEAVAKAAVPPPSRDDGGASTSARLAELEGRLSELTSSKDQLEKQLDSARLDASKAKLEAQGAHAKLEAAESELKSVKGRSAAAVTADTSSASVCQQLWKEIDRLRRGVQGLLDALPETEAPSTPTKAAAAAAPKPIDKVATALPGKLSATPNFRALQSKFEVPSSNNNPAPRGLWTSPSPKVDAKVLLAPRFEVEALRERIKELLLSIDQFSPLLDGDLGIQKAAGIEAKVEQAADLSDQYKASLDELRKSYQLLTDKFEALVRKEAKTERALKESREALESLKREKMPGFQTQITPPPSSESGCYGPNSLGLGLPCLASGGRPLRLRSTSAGSPSKLAQKKKPSLMVSTDHHPAAVGAATASLASIPYSSPFSATTSGSGGLTPDGYFSTSISPQQHGGSHSRPVSPRWVPPFASSLETRTGGRSSPSPIHAGGGGASELGHFNPIETGSTRSTSSPASISVGLPCTATSSSSTSSPATVPRTITLGMDHTSLVQRVRELEREMTSSGLWAAKRQAEKVVELESKLRESNRQLEKLRLDLEEAKVNEAGQQIKLLEELNAAQMELAENRLRGGGTTSTGGGGGSSLVSSGFINGLLRV
ncbi:hypothetical protein IE53DRAFT_367097 [Violaceomyces palustris]|uniref:Uncharacterized protein n=1 Tax=Violaceomyces palustris TaxID=1673888 RepID=A0ACD0P378_9BASI|nr:hypothetical protein IE53DRAFT_367097 [Violaceomyces palustris]